MKIYCVEWFSEETHKYNMEYFTDVMVAAKRLVNLQHYVNFSNPKLSTEFVDDTPFEGE